MFFSISKWFLLLASLITVCACSTVEKNTVPSTTPAIITSANIIDTRTGKTITANALLTQLASQSRVIVGEKHDNQYHHEIEYWLMTQLSNKRPQGAVLLEMLTPDQQNLVDNTKKRYSSSQYLRDERLMSVLNWNKGWSWKGYGNLIKEGLQADYPLLAANIDRSDITNAYKNPPNIEGEYSTQPAVRQLISKTIELSHGGALDKTQIEKMTVIQQLRDRAMAKSLLNAPMPALLIAGSFHATKLMGVPLHIKDLAPNETVTVLIMAEEGSDITSEHADYLWITPAAHP